MGSLFTQIIYRPILNLTVLLYGVGGLNDLGIAIILMTIAIRALLFPLSLKTARSQKTMAELGPAIEEVKGKHKGNTAAQSEAVMAMYRERGVNPLAGCLPLVIQLPILLGMYRVFLNIFKPQSLDLLYHAIPHPGSISHQFLGWLDISGPNRLFALAAGALQFLQARLAAGNQPATGQAAAVNKQMMYLLPVMIVVISWNLPAGLALYWITTTVFSIGEQLYLRRR